MDVNAKNIFWAFLCTLVCVWSRFDNNEKYYDKPFVYMQVFNGHYSKLVDYNQSFL